MQQKVEKIPIAEWDKDRLCPVIIPEALAQIGHEQGLISDEALEALHGDFVVRICGYWSVMSRYLKASPELLAPHLTK